MTMLGARCGWIWFVRRDPTNLANYWKLRSPLYICMCLAPPIFSFFNCTVLIIHNLPTSPFFIIFIITNYDWKKYSPFNIPQISLFRKPRSSQITNDTMRISDWNTTFTDAQRANLIFSNIPLFLCAYFFSPLTLLHYQASRKPTSWIRGIRDPSYYIACNYCTTIKQVFG